jgi:ABC-type transport system involved in cytochrome bd biosynthesis fused ATPase/permease subunit
VARRSTIRASDADRDSVVERLRTAAAEGRLAAHELEHRVTTALKAKTYGELDATVADLPGVQRERRPARRAVGVVRAHPALLLVAIPVAMIVVAAMVAITALWAAVTLAFFVLGHNRRMMYRGPWMYRRHVHRGGGPGYLPWV